MEVTEPEPFVPENEIDLTYLPTWAWTRQDVIGTYNGLALLARPPTWRLGETSFFMVQGSINNPELAEGDYAVTFRATVEGDATKLRGIPVTVFVTQENNPSSLIKQDAYLPIGEETKIVTDPFRISGKSSQVDVFLVYSGNLPVDGLVLFGAIYELVNKEKIINLTYLPTWAWSGNPIITPPLMRVDGASFFTVHGSINGPDDPMPEGVYRIVFLVELKPKLFGEPPLPLTLIVTQEDEPSLVAKQRVVVDPNGEQTKIVTDEFELRVPGARVDVFLNYEGSDVVEGFYVFGAIPELV